MTPEEENQFQVIKALERDPESSQRDLSRATGMSVGKMHSVIHALVQKGLLKIGRFYEGRKRPSKVSYVLTADGLRFRMRLTESYLALKRKEFEQLRAEIEALEHTARLARQGSQGRHT